MHKRTGDRVRWVAVFASADTLTIYWIIFFWVTASVAEVEGECYRPLKSTLPLALKRSSKVFMRVEFLVDSDAVRHSSVLRCCWQLVGLSLGVECD